MKGNRSAISKLWRTKLRPWWHTYEWPVVLALGLLAALLGYVGLRKHLPEVSYLNTPWDLLYRTLQLFLVDSGSFDSIHPPLAWELDVARFLAPFVAAYTAVQALTIIFAEQLTSIRLRMLKDHVVICGLGRKGMLLTRSFLERGELVVVIEQDESNDYLDWCRERGAIVIRGNAASRETLAQVRVHRARYLISVAKGDGVNAEVSVHARNLFKERKGDKLTCLIHISDAQLCNLLREEEIKSKEMDLFRMEFFSVFETGARMVLKEYPPFDDAGLINGSQPCMLVVGLGQMGGSLVVEAARKWKRAFAETGKRLRLIVVDRAANQKSESLCVRYPLLKKICNIVPLQMELNSPDYQHSAFLFDESGNCVVTAIYLCIGEDSIGLSAALTLHQYLRQHAVPIVVRMNHNTGLATLLGEEISASFSHVHAFGVLDRTCTPSLLLGGTHELLAQAIHEEYVSNQKQLGATPASNPSIAPWKELPEHLKDSNRRQADHIGIKLKAVNCEIRPFTELDTEQFQFAPDEVEKLAEMEHERWVDERRRDGWVFGKDKDVEKKITPYLVPWNELTEELKDYDRNTVRRLPAFLERVGFQIEKVRKQQA